MFGQWQSIQKHLLLPALLAAVYFAAHSQQ
jgi:hypothetical protein